MVVGEEGDRVLSCCPCSSNLSQKCAHIDQENRAPPTCTTCSTVMGYKCSLCPQKMQVGVWKPRQSGRDGVGVGGWNVPAVTSSPRPNTSYIFNTRIHSGYLLHINRLHSVCARERVWVCVVVVVGSAPSRQRGKKNDLFNTSREHLTLNLSETGPGKKKKKAQWRIGDSSKKRRWKEKWGGGVGPCWPAPRRVVGLNEIWKVFLPPNDCAAC